MVWFVTETEPVKPNRCHPHYRITTGYPAPLSFSGLHFDTIPRKKSSVIVFQFQNFFTFSLVLASSLFRECQKRSHSLEENNKYEIERLSISKARKPEFEKCEEKWFYKY